MADPPEVTILLLGDAEVGKSTFLSYVSISFSLQPRLIVSTHFLTMCKADKQR